jgi:membrane-associated HD superfamily phosphohydrolase
MCPTLLHPAADAPGAGVGAIPMAGSIKSILNAVVVIAVAPWLQSVFGLLSSLSNIHVGK